MAARMNDDLDFSHAAATADLGFRPRPFMPRSPLIPTTHDTGLA
jgi:hypothetical protein